MGSNHPVQVIAVTGGKGGIGKTNVSVNLSLALADMGRRVVLLDADLIPSDIGRAGPELMAVQVLIWIKYA